MYSDFENKKLIIKYNSDWIILSDWHERNKSINTQEQLFDILHTAKHNFSDQEIVSMKNHMWIDLPTSIQKIIENELVFETSRAWGHGWQNVNKVETKVQLFFNIQTSKYLDQAQKDLIIFYAHPKQLHHDNSTIQFQSQKTRDQAKNKQETIKEFSRFLNDALTPDKERIDTQLPPHKKQERVESKKKHSKKKTNRKPISID